MEAGDELRGGKSPSDKLTPAGWGKKKVNVSVRDDCTAVGRGVGGVPGRSVNL